MYNELESVGVHELEYFCNAFILLTVIYNKNYKNSDGYLENPAIEERTPSIQSEKLFAEKLKKDFLNKNYCENTKDNILAVYNDIDTNQIFGTKKLREYWIVLRQELKKL